MGVEKNVGVVDVFTAPYERWSQRAATFEESRKLQDQGVSLVESLDVKDRLLEVVSSHVEAAHYMLREQYDNGLEGHVNRALDDSHEYDRLRSLMPLEVPDALASYQGQFLDDGLAAADDAIKLHGVALAQGQHLFHGGLWPNGTARFTTTRAFSTSFCPQVALRNAEWKSKAFDAGRIDLMVVRVKESVTKAFAYPRDGDHGNEKEVVFAAGAQLTCISETEVSTLKVAKMGPGSRIMHKSVPAYLLEVDIT